MTNLGMVARLVSSDLQGAAVLVLTVFVLLADLLRMAASPTRFAKLLLLFQTHPGMRTGSFFSQVSVFFVRAKELFLEVPYRFFHVSLAKIMSHACFQVSPWHNEWNYQEWPRPIKFHSFRLETVPAFLQALGCPKFELNEG